jgi:hypothetical protein
MAKQGKRKKQRSRGVEAAASNDHAVSATNEEKNEASVEDVSRKEASTSTGGKRTHSVSEEGGKPSKSSKKRKKASKVPDPPVEEDDKGKNFPSSNFNLLRMIRSRLDQIFPTIHVGQISC